MKKYCSLGVTILLILSMATGCAGFGDKVDTKEIETVAIAFSIPYDNVITLTGDGAKELMDAVNDADLKLDKTMKTTPEKEQYRFSLLDKEGIAQSTVSIYNDELVQIDANMYTGDATGIISVIEAQSSTPTLADLSEAFELQPKEIAEISFYNNTTGQYKLVTKPQDIATIITPLQNLTLSPAFTPGKTTEEYEIHVCKADSRVYLPDIKLTISDAGTLMSCNSKSVYVGQYNWGTVFKNLNYNLLTIPE